MRSAGLDCLLNVVRQVAVRVVELVGGTLTLCVELTRLDREKHNQRQREQGAENGREARSASHLHLVDQKLISRLMWNTGPLAPTG